ncbi:hypothetical protein B4099_2273 [Heyndrickxia coagulans]|uniref:Uncharacterized protein n=1 Tax=Heyndrickxia coagulans TaxID=1398 RepID=A0A150JYD6_HEYCO|nr:hypothetical protein B4099_2273 [Heyndrickxia coagulans]
MDYLPVAYFKSHRVQGRFLPERQPRALSLMICTGITAEPGKKPA